MQSRTRTLLFIAVVVLFVIIAPLLVLYAKGYSFKTDTRAVVRTGMILIDANVPKVTVTLDQAEPRTENDPVILRSLVPGTYHVKLERTGYEPWEADLSVEAEKVTRVDNLLLTLSDPELQQPIKNTTGPFAVSPNSRFIMFVVTAGKDIGVWMHTNGNEANRQIVPPDTIDPLAITELRWSENSRLLLIKTKDGSYWHVSPHVSQPVATELPALKGLASEQIALDNDEPTIVYYKDAKNRLFRWRTGRPDTQPEQLSKDVIDFAVATPKVFTLTKTSTGMQLSSYDVRETEPAAVAVAPVSGTTGRIIAQGGSLVSVLSDETLWLLTREDGAFTFEQIAAGVETAKWSPNDEFLLYQKGLELWIHDLDPLLDEPTDFRFATMTAQPQTLFWHPEGAYVVVVHEQDEHQLVTLAHASRTAPRATLVATLTSTEAPQFARGGLDLVYKTTKPQLGLAILTIAEELD